MKPIPQYHTPAVYEIRVKGLLDPEWSSWLDNMTVVPGRDETVLTGRVPDQPALHGLLGKIRDIGLPLLSVNQIEPPLSPHPEPTSGRSGGGDETR